MDNSRYYKIHKKNPLKMTHNESPNYTILKLKAFNTILKETIRAAKYMYYDSVLFLLKVDS